MREFENLIGQHHADRFNDALRGGSARPGGGFPSPHFGDSEYG